LLWTVVSGLAWSVALVAVSRACFGTTLPPTVYEANVMQLAGAGERLAGLMLAPSRGLLVFCPYLLVIGYLLVAYRRSLPSAGLLLPAGLAVGGYVAVFAVYTGWHAGASYGPRYFCDVIPWFVLAAAMGVNGLLDAAAGAPRRVLELAALAACVAWGGFVHFRGANSPAAWEWNYVAQKRDMVDAVRDWSIPQFLAGVTFVVDPDGAVRRLKD
jgi:hypothetical protein